MLVGLAIDRGDTAFMTAATAVWSDWETPAAIVGVENWIEIIERCHEPEAILRRFAYDGAAKTLWQLYDAGHDLIYITSRDPNCADATGRWLRDNDFPYEDTAWGPGTLLCQYFSSKVEHIADCQLMIDDRPQNLVEFVYDFAWQNKYGSEDPTLQRFGLGLLSEYNRSLTDVPRIQLVPNWTLMRHTLLQKGLL